MNSKLLFYLYFFSTVLNATANSPENSFVILECPFGWIAIGQAWYAPQREGDQWLTNLPAFVGQTRYTTTLHLQARHIYFPNKYAICLICEHDSAMYHPDKSRMYLSKQSQRWVEVCGSQSSFMRTDKIVFEMQICEVINDGQGKPYFYTYEYTLNWCLFVQ